ncbi:TolC family outer membrane protein [Thioalkalivibrio sp. ALJT]|uniref:TolC family outer membrane protein n=1 Tax=Thioalkalivibrio sp. ALJT TaxID=1158146 RepID=UPI00035FA429|nr:TolC family outer membrane protein [Thioalkalivibrio sp. ALJT]
MIVGGSAQAAAPEPLRAAVLEAVLSNPDVQSQWHAFRAAGEEQSGARGRFLPEIDLNARTGYQSRRSNDDAFDSFSRNPRGVDITLTQMLYDGFETASEVNRLGEIQRVRYFELLETTEEIALEAVRAFADVQRQRALVELAQENYDAHKQVYDQILDQTERGVGRGVDLEQASGRLALAESNLLTERQNLHDVNARYYRIVGELPENERVDLVGSFSDEPVPATVQEALTAAITTNPAMFASLRNMEAAQEQRNVARSAFYPRLDLRLRHAYENDAFEREDIRTRDTSALLVMSWNLFRGGTDQARVRQFTEEFNQARDQHETVCRNVRQTVSVAYNDIRSLDSQLRFLRQHRDSSDRVRTAYRQQFGIGQRSLLDLLDTENEYFEASRAYINGQHDMEIARARALNGMGRLLGYLEISRSDMPSAAELGLVNDAARIDPDSVCPAEAPEMSEVRHESIFR